MGLCARGLLGAAVWIVTTGGLSAQDTAAVHYRFSINPGRVDVTVEFPAAAGDSLVLEMPSWAGVDLAAGVDEVVARDARGQALAVRRASQEGWVVSGTRGRQFQVAYAVANPRTDFVGDGRADLFRPALMAEWAFVWGHAVVLRARAGSHWRELPVRVSVTSARYGKVHTSTPAEPMDDVRQLGDALLVAGEFSEHDFSVRGVPIRVLVRRRDWAFSEAEFVAAVRRIAEVQADLLDAAPPHPGMVVLVEGSPRSSGGTVSGRAMAIYPNPAAPLSGSGVETLRLIAHEQFHVWNGSLFAPDDGVGEGYYKWFQEGLTEYYAWYTLLKAGLVDAAGFVAAVNRALREYAQNPVATSATASVLAERYWTTRDYQRLPYVKGFLLGLWTDLTLRQEGSPPATLEAVMRQVVIATDQGARRYDDGILLGALRAVGGPAWDDRYARFMLGAERLPLESLCGPEGFGCERPEVEFFDLGVTTDSGRVTGGAMVTGVAPHVAEAGFQVGDTLTGRVSIYNGDPTRDAMIEVRRGGEAVRIQYRPARRVAVQQLVADAATEEVVRRLAGRQGAASEGGRVHLILGARAR